MDYEGRDDFNNIVLRAFSLLGLITVLSGLYCGLYPQLQYVAYLIKVNNNNF